MAKLSPISYIFLGFIFIAIIILFIFPKFLSNNYFFLLGAIGTAIIVFYFLYKNIGFINSLFILLISGVCGFIFEYLGVHYYFLFGEYEYSEFFQPQLFQVPLIIPIAWFTAVLTSFLFARLIIGRIINNKIYLIFILAALICVLYDVPIEYLAMHAWKAWTWLNPGIIFGVPLLNFFGWFVVSLFIYFLGWKSWKQISPKRANYNDLQVILFASYGFTFIHFLIMLF